MQKIMFDDRIGLTKAVLEGHKTQTRRVVPHCTGVRLSPFVKSGFEDNHGYEIKPRYKVGEIVAIAQCYRDVGIDPKTIIEIPIKGSKTKGVMQCEASHTPGWTNKMFVKAELIAHKIRITNIRVERVQDISDEDCIKEGIHKWTKDRELYKYDLGEGFELYPWADKPKNPREVYARLIDKIGGRGTWLRNPYVFVYDFELVK